MLVKKNALERKQLVSAVAIQTLFCCDITRLMKDCIILDVKLNVSLDYILNRDSLGTE